MSAGKKLVLVDGSALAFRSFYALFTAGMRRSDGTPTWAVFGFLKALFDLLEQQRPDLMAVCFDLAEPTFRHVEFVEYKANRGEMPDDLSVQWPMIKAGVEALEVPLYELPGYEADDVIGTVAKEAVQKGLEVLILTGDQDAFQLLDSHIQVLMPGREGLTTYGRQEVYNKLGVWPEQVVDYKGLCGDASDNIPGVKGIGPKTAVELLSQFQTVERVYEHIEEVKKASVKQKLIDGRESAYASKKLATIRLDVPLEFDFEHCRLTLPKIDSVVEFFRGMEFNSILKRLPQSLAPFNDGVPPFIDPSLLEPVSRRRARPSAQAADAEQQPAGLDQGQSALTGSQLIIPSIQVRAASAPAPNIVRSLPELDSLCAELARQAVLSVDLETTGLNSLDTDIVGYALAWSPAATLAEDKRLAVADADWQVKTAYIPVRHQAEEQLAADLVAARLKPFLEEPRQGKIAQNAKFEMNVLSLVGITFSPLSFDPMLASYIVDPDQKHGLKDQAERILDYSMVRITELIGSGRKQISMDAVPVSKVAPYAADDARVALELGRYYSKRLDDEQKWLLWEMDMPLTAVIAGMEQAGVALDQRYLGQFSEELSTELGRLETEIYRLAGHGFNIQSTQQLQKVLFEELGLKTQGRTRSKTGFSTDAAVLEKLVGEHEIVSKILEFRQLSKLRSTYVDALPRQISPRDGRLHGEFNQAATATGRLSSSNPNLQNIPIRTELGRRIRRAFVPEMQSHRLISADYSQIELRLLAHMSGDETLIDAFQKNQDVHARTAMEIFDVPIDKVNSDMRRIGKTINFSLIYQQGAYSTAQDLNISTREAQAFIDKYFSRYPRVRTFMMETIEEARASGYAKTIWGRKRYFRNLNDRSDVVRRADERAACNAPLQGSAADLMKLAMIRLDQQLKERRLSAKLILQVHDELVLEVAEAEVEETRAVVLAAMGLDQPLRVPLQVDVGVASNWMGVK